MAQNRLLLSYYGDDFTGSTDVLEALTINGIPTALFLEPPDQETVSRFRLKHNISCSGNGSLKAMGVAGIARSMTPAEMDNSLPPIFKRLSDLDPELFHYKVCSTFDSSPKVGNIGRATELAQGCLDSPFIPLVIGAPILKRYTSFGNLFAAVDGITFRIDRHPTMSRHPVTPMDEGDIRLHLAKQTKIPVNLFDLLQMQGTAEQVDEKFAPLLSAKGEYILFDILDETHLITAGRLIWENRKKNTLFLVGSSGMEYALCEYWHSKGIAAKPPAPKGPGPAEKIVVMCGSCSPATGAQIKYAIDKGYTDIRIDGPSMADNVKAEKEIERIVSMSLDRLTQGSNVVIYSAAGPDDLAISKTKQALKESGNGHHSPSQVLGEAQGQILKVILEESGVTRAVVAGGDTSGYVAKQLGIIALEMVMPIAPGSPLCCAHSENPKFDGLVIALKGGQVGTPEYFEYCRLGKAKK